MGANLTPLVAGTTQPIIERFGPGILDKAGGKSLHFDAGRGCLQMIFKSD